MKAIHNFDQEMIFFLQDYLVINTAHPNPDYHSACDIFATQAQRDGFPYQKIILPSGRPTIIISYKGTEPSLPSLILNHHMDTVPATNTQEWITPPFAGTIKGDLIIARGVQDMKGVGVAHYFALKTIKEYKIKPQRTIHCVAIPDEEIGGFTGTKELLESSFFSTLNAGFVLDEGLPSHDKKTIFIKITERKPLQIKITIIGSLAHGSKLNCFNPIHEMIILLDKIVMHHQAQQKKSKAPETDGLLSSFNITSIKTGIDDTNSICVNSIPNTISAIIDIRIAPTIKIQDIIDDIDAIVKQHKNSSYAILASVPDQVLEENYETPLYNALAQSLQECNMQAKPLFFEGASDLRYYKIRGLDGIGFTPFTTQDNLHGTNESLPIADLIQGKNFLVHFLKKFCLININ